VDEVDADKVKRDPRLPFGLPGVNKSGKVSNGNYLWISYFYSYLSERGRAGFVMSSQASGAGRDEAKVRQKLVESGDVDVMIAIRSNFFYTRTVPCELWFLNRGKQEANRDKVLMIDARNIYRKVTRKINDFSPEQLQNLLAITWLYRAQGDRFLRLVGSHLENMLTESKVCFEKEVNEGTVIHPLPDFAVSLATFQKTMQPFLDSLPGEGAHAEALQQLTDGMKTFNEDIASFLATVDKESTVWTAQEYQNGALKATSERLAGLAETSHDLIKQADLLYKLASRLVDICENELEAKESPLWVNREIVKARKTADETRQLAVEQLKKVRYFHRQAVWLIERFPDAVLRDVEGLVKLVDRAELAANDWSLTPGRYVGVAPEEEDDGFDFEETLREIHVELEGLNIEAIELAAKIKKNFEELGI
ncbi:MAG: N-6 DNA methylase, partial [Deltaproteobacteria bacterium]|nr:N-6 DNA methylase [Deltaproteobacteria bacterium]